VTATVPAIVITGNMGSGKTTILAQASDLLTADAIVHGEKARRGTAGFTTSVAQGGADPVAHPG